MSTIQETVAVLEAVDLEDDQPNIEAPSPAIMFDGSYDTHFVERKAFDTKWAEETTAMTKCEEVLEQGDYYINMVYTYRSCSKALPQVKNQDDPNKNEIYERTFEVLEPEIQKLKTFMYFQRDNVKLFCDYVRQLANDNKKEIFSEDFLYRLARLLDLFSILDALKNMKACLNNDFSFYKRAFTFLRKNMGNDDQTQDNHTLYLFLANQNSITTNLKTEIQQIPGFDDVLSLIINQCATWFEEQRWVTPNEKHILLRVMSYGLVLMDGDQPQTTIFRNKKLVNNLSRFSRIFRRYPVVPLFGDMQLSLDALIRRSQFFDEKVWGTQDTDWKKQAPEYELVYQINQARASYQAYMSRFCLLCNEIRSMSGGASSSSITFGAAQLVFNTMREGIQMLSDWSARVQAQSAWKYAHPSTDAPADCVEYERVVLRNYSKDELFVLTEFIAMIKGLAGVMMREEAMLMPILLRSVHDETQEFTQKTLREMIRNASKKKRAVRSELLQLRALSADWMNGIEPNDPALFGKKPSKESDRVTFPTREVGPSSTQLELMRAIVYSFVAFKYFGKKSPYSDKDFSGEDLKALETFYQRSFWFPYLSNPNNTIAQCTDLADLWYREFYLEMTKRLQFPIEMSLPWILADNILESHNTSMMEYVLYPLDIYNDAANRALNQLRQQFLFSECEAELNLAFDQLVYKLAEQTFLQYKQQAAAIMLDKTYKSSVEILYPGGRFNPPKSRFEPLLRQRHVQLIGRMVDLNMLMAQRLNTYLRQNIDFAVSRFEASDITTVVELENQLSVIRLTYDLLKPYFDLDAWPAIFGESNESTSMVSFHGRIVLHCISEIVVDFLPNFNFNTLTQRFVRTVLSFADEVTRASMPKTKMNFMYGTKALNSVFAHVAEMNRKFFGRPHLEALLRLVGRTNIGLVVSEIMNNAHLKIVNVLAPYVRELTAGMPPSSKLPLYEYGTPGCYGYFQLKLKEIIAYPDLRTEVFLHFKEFGNTVILLNLLDAGLGALANATFVQAAPFLGLTPETWTNPPVEGQDPSSSSPLFSYTQAFCSAVAQTGACKSPATLNDLNTAAWRADKYYRPEGVSHSMFKSCLHRLAEMIKMSCTEWLGAQSADVIPVDTSTEFYRLWSGLQFVYCLPTGNNEISMQELFGDGLQWSGCIIIYLLNQRDRFETLDFCYHILNVEESSDAPSPDDPATNLHSFFRKAVAMRDLNTLIFELLHSYWQPEPATIMSFRPPEEDSATSYVAVMSAAGAAAVSPSPRPAPAAAAAAAPQSARAPSQQPQQAPPSARAPPAAAASQQAPPSARAPPAAAAPPPPPPMADLPPPPPPPAAANLPPPPPMRHEDELPLPPAPPMRHDDDEPGDALPPPPPMRADDLPPPQMTLPPPPAGGSTPGTMRPLPAGLPPPAKGKRPLPPPR